MIDKKSSQILLSFDLEHPRALPETLIICETDRQQVQLENILDRINAALQSRDGDDNAAA